jgi:hypothetical protein
MPDKPREAIAVIVSRAGDTDLGQVPNVRIEIIGELPADLDSRSTRDVQLFYGAQARQIDGALRGSLPGGVYDRLVARMLVAKAGDLTRALDPTQSEYGALVGKYEAVAKENVSLRRAYDLTLTLIAAIREMDWSWAPRNSRAGELIPATCDEVETALRGALATDRGQDASKEG